MKFILLAIFSSVRLVWFLCLFLGFSVCVCECVCVWVCVCHCVFLSRRLLCSVSRRDYYYIYTWILLDEFTFFFKRGGGGDFSFPPRSPRSPPPFEPGAGRAPSSDRHPLNHFNNRWLMINGGLSGRFAVVVVVAVVVAGLFNQLIRWNPRAMTVRAGWFHPSDSFQPLDSAARRQFDLPRWSDRLAGRDSEIIIRNSPDNQSDEDVDWASVSFGRSAPIQFEFYQILLIFSQGKQTDPGLIQSTLKQFPAQQPIKPFGPDRPLRPNKQWKWAIQ